VDNEHAAAGREIPDGVVDPKRLNAECADQRLAQHTAGSVGHRYSEHVGRYGKSDGAVTKKHLKVSGRVPLTR
jgi:hypothetical protein